MYYLKWAGDFIYDEDGKRRGYGTRDFAIEHAIKLSRESRYYVDVLDEEPRGQRELIGVASAGTFAWVKPVKHPYT